MPPDLIMLPVGFLVGVINSVAGGGMILAFPVMLGLGYSPYVANVTNTIGVFPSNLGGVLSYRRVLAADRRLVMRLMAVSAVGSLTGAVILLNTPEEVFTSVVPFLIGGATLLLLAQPLVARRVADSGQAASFVVRHRRALAVGVFAASVYGGYFGATTGVILLAVLGATTATALKVLNGHKNAIAVAINTVGVLVFAAFAPVAWTAGLLQAAGALFGGLVGGRVAQWLPERLFRLLVVAVGVFATGYTAIS